MGRPKQSIRPLSSLFAGAAFGKERGRKPSIYVFITPFPKDCLAPAPLKEQVSVFVE